MDVVAHCPGCRAPELVEAGDAGQRRVVCSRCGRCWEAAGTGATEIDTLACGGCQRRTICESRPTSLALTATSEHVLTDGTRVRIRPLLYSDRWEVAAGYQQLSDEARRLRFFTAPPELSETDLEYLANLDYRDHFAWVALATDEAGSPGVGVARYIRRRDEFGKAEAAVTVLDDYEHRGLGTLLLEKLAERARQNGIGTFVSFVLWVNGNVIDALVAAGARVVPDEPGVARVEIDLPGNDPRAPTLRFVTASGQTSRGQSHRRVAWGHARVRGSGMELHRLEGRP